MLRRQSVERGLDRRHKTGFHGATTLRQSAARCWGIRALRLDPDAVEPETATWMRAKLFHLWPADRPNEPHVDRNPREILREQGLSADVQPLALRPEEELARSNQQIVEAVIAVKGEIHRPGALRRTFGAGR